MRALKLISLFAILLMAGCTSWGGAGVGKKITPGAKSLDKSALNCFNGCNYRCRRERLGRAYKCIDKLDWVPPLDLPTDIDPTDEREPLVREPWGYTPESVVAYHRCIGEAFVGYGSCIRDCDTNCVGVGDCYVRCMRTLGDVAVCVSLCEGPMER